MSSPEGGSARESGIDPDALIERIAEAFETAKQMGFPSWANTKFAEAIVDAILPTVEQAIRAAEQRGREQAAQAVANMPIDWDAPILSSLLRATDLARGGSTDEEQK